MNALPNRAFALAALLLSLAACTGGSSSIDNANAAAEQPTDPVQPEPEETPPDPVVTPAPPPEPEPEPEPEPVPEPEPQPDPVPTPLPRVTLTSISRSIETGETTTLSWTASNVDGCEASGGWSGNRPTAGNEETPVLNETTTFQLSCSGVGGSITRTVTVQVVDNVPPPEVTLSVDQTLVDNGDSVVLTWTSTNADSCETSDNWTGSGPSSVATEGSQSVGPLNANSTFSLTCSNVQGSAVEMVSVNVTAELSLSWVAPTENVDGTPLTDLDGYRIYYGVSSRNYGAPEEVTDSSATSVSIEVPSGSYYVAMTAMDAEGNESGYSNEVLKNTN